LALLSQIDFALKGFAIYFANGALAVQVGMMGTASPKQRVKPSHQTCPLTTYR
jgi:hypothetical protein